MAQTNRLNPPPDPAELPFVAPCRVLNVGAPLGWLVRGWADFRRTPQSSIAMGSFINE